MRKQKITFIAPLMVSALLLPPLAFAEDTNASVDATTSTSSGGVEASTDTRMNQGLRPLGAPKPGMMMRNEMREDNAQMRTDFRADVKAMKGDLDTTVQTTREANKDAAAKLRADVKAKIESGELTPEEGYKTIEEQVKSQREQAKQTITAAREEFKKDVAEKRGDLATAIEEKRSETLASIQANRDAFKADIEARKEEIQAKLAEAKDALKAGLENIKDAQKKEKVEATATSIQDLNTKAVDGFTTNIAKIESALASIESRTDIALANSIDVSKVQSDITLAETAIADARTAISAQSSKVYSVTITSDAGAKEALKTTNTTFKTDLKVVQTAMKKALEAVKKAAADLRAIPNVNSLTVTTQATVEADTTTSTTN